MVVFFFFDHKRTEISLQEYNTNQTTASNLEGTRHQWTQNQETQAKTDQMVLFHFSNILQSID